MVQMRAVRFVKNIRYHAYDDQPSITAALGELHWDMLKDRRTNDRVILFYKLINKLIKIPDAYQPVPKTGRDPDSLRTHSKQYHHHTLAVDAYKHSFIPRTIVTWDDLDEHIAYASSLEELKELLRRPQN